MEALSMHRLACHPNLYNKSRGIEEGSLAKGIVAKNLVSHAQKMGNGEVQNVTSYLSPSCATLRWRTDLMFQNINLSRLQVALDERAGCPFHNNFRNLTL